MDYLQRLPIVPVTRALCNEIEAQLADPGVAAARRAATGALASAFTPGSVNADVVVGYMSQVSITGDNMGPHALRLVGDLIEKISDVG